MRTHQPHIATRRAGFMLVEVLVALAIMAVGITGLIFAMSQSLARSQLTREYTTAIFLAHQVMVEEEKRYAFSEESAFGRRGEFQEYGLPDFSYRSDVEQNLDLMQYEIEVTINWEHRGTEQSFQVRQIVPSHRETIEEMGRRGGR